MRAALKLFKQLGIKYIPPSESGLVSARPRTHCINIVDKLIRDHGLGHATITLRTIAESSGNATELTREVIMAVSDVIRTHPRWVGLGLAFVEAFDSISLAQCKRLGKATGVQPVRVAIATLICLELEKIVGPSKLPKPPKPSRSDLIQSRLAVGAQILELRAQHKLKTFRRLLPVQFNKEAAYAVTYMRITERYGSRPEICSRVSWSTLRALTDPSLSYDARSRFERAIIAGRTVTAAHIERSRRSSKSGARPIEQPAQIAA